MLNKLSRLLDEAGISLTDHQKNQLVAYVGLLDKWNKAYNLTSVRDPNEMLVRHILDSPSLSGVTSSARVGDMEVVKSPTISSRISSTVTSP